MSNICGKASTIATKNITAAITRFVLLIFIPPNSLQFIQLYHYYQKGAIKAALRDDSDITKALEVLHKPDGYAAIFNSGRIIKADNSVSVE